MATTSGTPRDTHSFSERASKVASLLAGLLEDFEGLPEAEVVHALGPLEDVGRRADALRVRAAGEIDARSGRDRESSLARRYDFASAVGLLEHVTHVAPAEIRARIRLDRLTRPSTSLTGEELPPEYPVVAAALRAGVLGVDVATHLTDAFERASRVAVIDPVEAATAEREIVNAVAAGFYGAGPLAGSDDALPQTFDDYRAVEGAWIEFLTRNGIEPTTEEVARRRMFSVGRVRPDGLAHIFGRVTPEVAGAVTRLLDAYTGSTAQAGSPVSFRTSPEQADPGEPWADTEMVHDPRTKPQIRHDAFMSMIQAAAASADAPTIGGAAPTLVVTVDAEQLTSEGGVADIDGIGIAVPASVAHRIACTGAVQKVVFGADGQIMALGTPQRLFTSHQRRAIAARDGGCIIPGCHIPAAWCEIHHVEEHSKGGPTHTDNGVLLCWAHHHDIGSSGWEIRMRDGVPYVKAPHWMDQRDQYRPVVNRRSIRKKVRRRVESADPPAPVRRV